jgi:hypothetical protein
MLQQARPILEEYAKRDLLEAREVLAIPHPDEPALRFAREKWFPRSLARKLRTFWDRPHRTRAD